MPDFLFDLPLLITGPAIVLLLCAYAVVGLLITRRWILPRLRSHPEDSEFSGAMLQAVMVFYGLAVALIAVSVWQSYSDVTKITSQEATTLAALYRDVSSYPETIRPQLQERVRDYVDQIIHQAWPLQERGKTPTAGVELINRFQDTLDKFEPASEGQKILHAETLRTYNQVIQARRLRLDAVNTRLPGILWFIIVAGAFISLTSSFFFKVEDARFQGIHVVLLATFIGLIIFMTLALDRPFRGDLRLRPGAYELVYDQLMKPSPPGTR